MSDSCKFIDVISKTKVGDYSVPYTNLPFAIFEDIWQSPPRIYTITNENGNILNSRRQWFWIIGICGYWDKLHLMLCRRISYRIVEIVIVIPQCCMLDCVKRFLEFYKYVKANVPLVVMIVLVYYSLDAYVFGSVTSWSETCLLLRYDTIHMWCFLV